MGGDESKWSRRNVRMYLSQSTPSKCCSGCRNSLTEEKVMREELRRDLRFATTKDKITEANRILERMARLVGTGSATPALAASVLTRLSSDILELDTLITSMIDPGEPNAARKQLKQDVEKKLGKLEKRVEWSPMAEALNDADVAKSIGYIPPETKIGE